jgi:hypothetical protein
MRPGYIALVFWGVSAFAVFGILKSLQTGVVTGSIFTYRINQQPVAFLSVILGRTFIIAIAIAETLYALGLTGDPIAAFRSIMPFHEFYAA